MKQLISWTIIIWICTGTFFKELQSTTQIIPQIPIQKKLPDTSFRIHQRVINNFLSTLQTFSGKGEKKIGTKRFSYEWQIKNPQIAIHPKGANFNGDIFIKIGNRTYTDSVKGQANLSYDTQKHLIDIHVTSAKFPLKINLLGQSFTLITIDIAQFYPIHFYFPSFTKHFHNIPLPQANNTDLLNILFKEPKMELITANILLSSDLHFEKTTPNVTPLPLPKKNIEIIP